MTSRPAKPAPRSLATIDGIVTVALDESRWETMWRKCGIIVNPLAAIGLLFATLVVGITTLTQQSAQADAVVMADRQNAALAGLAAAYNLYDRGGRAISAVEQFQTDPVAHRDFVTAAGQEFDTSSQEASTRLFSAAAKAAGYPSTSAFTALEDTASRAHAAVAIFYTKNVVPREKLAVAQFSTEKKKATEALSALLIAINNASRAAGCDFGYPNGKGAEALKDCPLAPSPVPTIELPPGTTRDGETHR